MIHLILMLLCQIMCHRLGLGNEKNDFIYRRAIVDHANKSCIGH